MNVPERIFAIGGAGKAIALTLLESDWVLDEVLRPQPNPESLTVTIIDTAEGEKNTDQRRIQHIKSRIAERQRELRDTTSGRTGTITVEYKLITEDLHLSGSIDLLGERAVPRIAAGNGMDEDDWWLREEHINENLDFAKGVVRKRGLGKAIYYKAYAEDDEISSYIDLPQKGKVAVLVGLGGGTGSGLVMDLAHHIRRKQRTAEVTLFGVLPNHTEGRKETANAFAALSEIEYSALQDEQLFTDCVLIPIDPTNFDGKTGNRIKTDRFLQELDEAVLYLLLSYYNTEGLEDPFDGTPRYAPFTIGIPQVLRYNIEAITEARERSREILKIKEEALQQEEEIYRQTHALLAEQYRLETDEQERSLRNLDRTDLQERLEDIEAWLDFGLFDDLGYESVDTFTEIVADAKAESDDITEQIDFISSSLGTVDLTRHDSGSFVDDIDEYLAQVVEKDLRLLDQRKQLLEYRQRIDDTRIKETIEYLLGSTDSRATSGIRVQQIETKLVELEEQHETLLAELEELQSQLETKQHEQEDEVETRISRWMEDVENDVGQLERMDLGVVQATLSNLDGRIDQFVYEVVEAVDSTEIEQAPDEEILGVVDDVSKLFGSAGVDGSDILGAICDSVEDLKQAKQAFLTIHQEENTIEKLTPWKSSTKQSHEQAQREYQLKKNTLNDNGIFELRALTDKFTVTIRYDSEELFERYQQQRSILQRSIVEGLENELERPSREQLSVLEAEVDSAQPDLARLRELGRDLLRQQLGTTDELEGQKNSLERNRTEVQRQITVHEAVIDLVQKLDNRREAWMTRHQSFRNRLSSHEERTNEQVSEVDNDSIYIRNIQPEDIFRATGHENITTSGLFGSEEEKQRIRTALETFARNAQNQQYTGLYRRKIAKERARYDGLKVRVAAMSPAIHDLDPDTLDFRDTFQGAFDLGASGKRVESPFASWRQEAGGPWDISLSVFVTGVFLDNLRKVTQADGYFTGYQRRANALEEDILIHHSYGLENGYYVRRTDTLNLEADDDIEFFLRDEDTIADELLAEYLETKETA